MKHRILWSMALILALAMAGTVSCDCGDDDDDDDDLIGGDDDASADDCSVACATAFDCGGQFWWNEEAECVESCNEWRETSYGCADCFIQCGTSDDSCVAIGLCLADCGLTDCAEVLEDLAY